MISNDSATLSSPHRTTAATPAAANGWERPLRLLPLLSVLVLLAWHAWTLMHLAPWVDEAWGANRALALLQTGRAFGTLDSGVFEQFPGYWTYFPWLGTAIQAIPIWLAGVDLVALRVESLLFGAVLLGVVFALGRAWSGRGAGWLAAVLVGGSQAFAWSAHLARADIVVAVLGYGAAWLLLADSAPARPWRAFLAGLLATLGLDVHLDALVFVPALVAGLIVLDGWRLWRSRRAWALGVGLVGGLLWFAGFHLLSYPGTFQTLFALGNAATRTPPLLDPGAWPQLLQNLLIFLLLTLLLQLLIVPLAIAQLLRQPEIRVLLVFGGTLLLAFAVVVREPRFFYGILLTPAAGLVLACWLVVWVPAGWRRGVAARLLRAVVLSCLAGSLIVTLLSMIHDAGAGFADLRSPLRAAVPDKATVIGVETFWLAIPEYHYLSVNQLVYYQRLHPDNTWADAFAALHADVLILTWWPDLYPPDEGRGPAGGLAQTLHGEALGAFLARQASPPTIITGFDSSIIVYSLNRGVAPIVAARVFVCGRHHQQEDAKRRGQDGNGADVTRNRSEAEEIRARVRLQQIRLTLARVPARQVRSRLPGNQFSADGPPCYSLGITKISALRDNISLTPGFSL